MFGFRKRKFSKKDKPLMELRVLQIALGILIGVVLAGGIVLLQTHKDKVRLGDMRAEATQAQTDPHQVIPPGTAKIGGPFSLTDQDGKPVTDKNYAGKYLLIYFGYTYCPDMCPTGLSSMAHAMDQLGDSAAKVQPLFITIDPARDTAAKMKEYAAEFHPKIIGLTGTAAQIASVAKEYEVYYAKGEMVDDKDYVMDHSSLIYLMAPDGHFIATFDEQVNPADIVKRLKAEWAKKPATPHS